MTKRLSSGLAQRLFGAGSGTTSPQASDSAAPNRVLAADDLFHPFTESPSPEIRRRAAFIRQHASCPHHAHHGGGLPSARVDFECPDCGIPVYCSREHWMDDYEAHLKICDTLRQINEDDHDLRSGRFFPEFEYAGPQIEEALVNMTNWDTFLYTRGFQAINDDRSMRQATRLLTYPITVASVIHELSPYDIKAGGRLTVEGLKSFSGTYARSRSLFVSLTVSQPYATPFIPQSPAAARMSRASGWSLRQCGCLSLERGLNHRCPAMCGCSWRISSRSPSST